MGACGVDHGVVGTNWGPLGALYLSPSRGWLREPSRRYPAVSHGDVSGKHGREDAACGSVRGCDRVDVDMCLRTHGHTGVRVQTHVCAWACAYGGVCAHAPVGSCMPTGVRSLASWSLTWKRGPPGSWPLQRPFPGEERRRRAGGGRQLSPTSSWHIQEKRRFAKQEGKCEPIFRELVLEKHGSGC